MNPDHKENQVEFMPYSTCSGCLVKDWCGRKNGTSPLPADYDVNPECSGYVLLEQAFKLSGIPPEFRYANKRNFVFDNDNMSYREPLSESFDRVTDLVDNGANLFFVHPQKGTGKTRTACTIGNEYIFNACTNPERFDFENPLVMYVKYGTWANEIRQMYQVNDEDYNLKTLRMMNKMKNVPLLIIDDIGSGRLTPIIRDLTYDIIDHRKENLKSTIYTTNVPIPQLETDEYLGDIITSRMLFKTAIYQIGGRNRRKEETYYL